MGVLAIVQARMASTRLPGKVLLPAPDGRPLLHVLLERVRQARVVERVVVATAEETLSSFLECWALASPAAPDAVYVDRGQSPADVLGRFARCVQNLKGRVWSVRPDDVLVRLTADCALVCPEVIDRVVYELRALGQDYRRTGLSYPDGLDVEAMRVDALLRADQEATLAYDREHVTPWLRRRQDWGTSELSPAPRRMARLCVDDERDYRVVFSWLEDVGPAATLRQVLERMDAPGWEYYCRTAGVPRSPWQDPAFPELEDARARERVVA